MGESRPLGEQERLLNYLHAYGGLIALQVLHLRGRLDPKQVEHALAWLQTQHPILRTHVREGEWVYRRVPPFAYRQPYFETDGTTAIPLETFDDPDPQAWRAVLAKELRTPIKTSNAPRVRVTLVRQSTDAELSHIVICADHATLDAQSGNMLSRQLLEYLADPQTSETKVPLHKTLPPPLEAGLPRKSGGGSGKYQPALRLPKLKVPEPKRETRVVSYHLGADATAALKAAIKTNRTTLHGAVTAAFLTAMRELHGVSAMTSLTTIDLRRLMKPALPQETYGCYIDILRTRHDIGDDFWATARDASFRLINALAKDQDAASIMKLPGWEVYNKEAWPTITHNRRIDGLAVTTAGESGLLQQYGPYTLEDVTMAVSLDMFGPSIFAIASERLGGIDFSTGYAADAMSDRDAGALTDRAIAILEAAR